MNILLIARQKIPMLSDPLPDFPGKLAGRGAGGDRDRDAFPVLAVGKQGSIRKR